MLSTIFQSYHNILWMWQGPTYNLAYNVWQPSKERLSTVYKKILGEYWTESLWTPAGSPQVLCWVVNDYNQWAVDFGKKFYNRFHFSELIKSEISKPEKKNINEGPYI